MSYAILFENVMRYIWGDDNPPHDFIVRAVADKVRGTARINPENALDVLDGMAEMVASVWARVSDIESEDDVAIFTVEFIDRTSILIVAKRGIGSAVEVL
jgi:hypothetical protein